jgi:GAF domain-containing protein
MRIERFSALIEGFYAAALEPERWPEAVSETASFFGSESTVVQVRADEFSKITLRFTTANYDQAAQQAYVAHFHKVDLWANGWRAIGSSGVYAGRDLVHPETIRKSEIYNDFARRLGAFHSLGAGVNLDQRTQLLVGIHRPMQSEDFTLEHQRSLKLVLPHLSRAMQTHMLLAAANLQRRLAYEMLAALSVAAIVVDGGCRVVFTNSAADQVLKAGDGLRV